jgi:hypothetical protein
MIIQTDLKSLSHRNQLGAFLNARDLTSNGVEVGTLFGAHAKEILKSWKGHLHCVDPWRNQSSDVYFDGANSHDMEAMFAMVSAEIGTHERCTLHRMMSLNACGRFADGELDFVYLDGNHAIDAIRADIMAWWPKVRIGGVFSGHDFFTRYDHETNSDALTAVAELCEALGVRPHVTWDTSWWFIKTGELDRNFRDACLSGKLSRPAYSANSIDAVVVVPVARFDWNLAVKLLTWWKTMLDGQPNQTPVVALCSPELTESELDALGDSGLPNLSIVPAVGLKELGYFGSPNQMFKRALDHCEKHFPDHAMIWVEADCVPMSAGWIREIMKEYEKCGRPFMGDVQHEGAIPHLTGTAVYPPNWRKLAPSLAALPGPIAEMGWDSQCAHDVLPRAHESQTIQQVWRPPLPITKQWFNANIGDSTALFHQCKDGSLIDLLCRERGLPMIPLADPLCASTYESDKARFADISAGGVRYNPAPKYLAPGRVRSGVSIVIVTCKRDAEMLRYCLASIKKYATGFDEVVVVVPVQDVKHFAWVKDATLTTMAEVPNKGFICHLIQKCRADELCPKADFILHLDADCLFWRPVTPGDFVRDGRCLMVRERYEDIGHRNTNRLIWRQVVDRAIGFTPEWEGMTRHPAIYPRALYAKVRERVYHQWGGMPFDAYVMTCENNFPQGFAEHPTFAAVGIQEMEDKFNFVDYDHARDARELGIGPEMPFQYAYRPERDFLVEGWSHAGMQRYRADWDKFLSGNLPKYYLK